MPRERATSIYSYQSLRKMLCTVILITPALAFSQGAYQEESHSLNHQDRKRSYIVHYSSDRQKEKPSPLLIVLHGGGASVRGTVKTVGISEMATKRGYLVAFPNGTGKLKNTLLTWNAGRCCHYSIKHKIDDVGFISQVIDNIDKDFDVDLKRVYLTGLSNGAMMSYRAACELSSQIAAIAPVAGQLNINNCKPTTPVSILHFHGTADKAAKFEGGKTGFPKKRVDLPVQHGLDFWKKFNACQTTQQEKLFDRIMLHTYSNCSDNVEMQFYKIIGGSHTWPGGQFPRLYQKLNPPVNEISASLIMLDFFDTHPKN